MLGGGGWSQKTKEYHTDTVRRGGRGQEWAGPGASVSFPIRRARRDAKKERERTKKTKEERKRSIFKQKKRTKKNDPTTAIRSRVGRTVGGGNNKKKKKNQTFVFCFVFFCSCSSCVCGGVCAVSFLFSFVSFFFSRLLFFHVSSKTGCAHL